MKGNEIYEVFRDIDEKYIEEAAQLPGKGKIVDTKVTPGSVIKGVFGIAAGAAACAAAVAAVILVRGGQLPSSKPYVPNNPASYIDSDFSDPESDQPSQTESERGDSTTEMLHRLSELMSDMDGISVASMKSTLLNSDIGSRINFIEAYKNKGDAIDMEMPLADTDIVDIDTFIMLHYDEGKLLSTNVLTNAFFNDEFDMHWCIEDFVYFVADMGDDIEQAKLREPFMNKYMSRITCFNVYENQSDYENGVEKTSGTIEYGNVVVVIYDSCKEYVVTMDPDDRLMCSHSYLNHRLRQIKDEATTISELKTMVNALFTAEEWENLDITTTVYASKSDCDNKIPFEGEEIPEEGAFSVAIRDKAGRWSREQILMFNPV